MIVVHRDSEGHYEAGQQYTGKEFLKLFDTEDSSKFMDLFDLINLIH